jgi:NAD(P)-dependent dehydrogenase (short-subunit alcohol dehydrogenase family)
MYLKKINLKNKTALVTGAGKGIGRACAIALAEAGADLIIVSRTQKDLNNVFKIIKKLKSKCSTFTCDVTNYSQIKNIISKQKKIDILVNNAGTNIPEHFVKIQKKNLEYLVKINTMATFHIAQLCALKMLETKNRKKIGGSIINMSKFGLEGLTKGMAIDLAKNNIRVNTICPTFVDTPMTKRFFKNKSFKKEVLNKIPLGRIAEVSDVATAAAFLASNASSMITGTSILVDGGWTAI